ncbi:pyridoxal phosphate-dependent aminotransferase [Syntrophus aciditrophicus]|uniref:Aminotransferase n=1 Tax=Syntrophus aciditrophicus (strain SB) TaxID=56780 RepID=Q2LTN0_SYNAS|nr:pyridoxal phosphate-dependent aminotransferase [Syntrophus aciditrophicus]ABC77442.1 aspartate aminotransferase [Syntrophus aciditrophicus SB]OPY19066.1 MAG: Aspartate aminotransferase [Syntrophus sp. PtaB.Bin075]
MPISNKIHGLITRSSWIRKMFEEGLIYKKKYGPENVYDFTLGNPNVPPPSEFGDALLEVAAQSIPGKHGYMPNAGYPETREAIAAYLTAKFHIPLTADHIIMTCGAAGALNVTMKTILDPGDEVIIPTPYFVEYEFYVDNAGGISRLVPTKEDFNLDLEAIRSAFTEKTRAVLINSPNNPTGRVYDEETIRGLAAIIEEKGRLYNRAVYLVSDEPYSDIVYDGIKVPFIMECCKNSIIAFSYSKCLSVPGERIGYLALHPELADLQDVLSGMIFCNRILGYINAPALMQRVISHIQGVHVNVEEYKRKRDLLCEGLSACGYSFAKPEGTFYLFVRSPIADDVTYVRALQLRRVLTTPGIGFGGPGYFRIAYCVDDAAITNAMPGFADTLKEYQNR